MLGRLETQRVHTSGVEKPGTLQSFCRRVEQDEGPVVNKDAHAS
jgi:hypothetical protein